MIFAGWRIGTKEEKQHFLKQLENWSAALLQAGPAVTHSTGDHGVSTGLPFLILSTQTQNSAPDTFTAFNLSSEHVLPDTHLLLHFSHQAGRGNHFFQSGDVGLPCSGRQGLALLQPVPPWGCHTLKHDFAFPAFIFFSIPHMAGN